LFRILKACYHENSFSSSFDFKSSKSVNLLSNEYMMMMMMK